MMTKDVLFLCQFFYPEYNSSATLPFDTAKHLASKGYRVGALCGYPKEYSKSGKVPSSETKDGVNIRRLKYLQLDRRNRFGRLINFFSFTLSVLLHIGYFRNYKAVVVYSNPPVLPIIAVIANRLFQCKIIFVAYDLYPEVAYASASVTRGSLIDRVMKKINQKMYGTVAAVVALTEEMKAFIIENRTGISEDRIYVIPNWAHEETGFPKEEDYQHFGYRSSQLIVSYFGNMGICQDMETMLSAIADLKDREDIQFLIVGHGNKKEYVTQRTRGYRNVCVLEFLTGEDFDRALRISNCGIVSLENGLKGMCAPSKYYSYLQSGCAVLSVVEKGSYLASEITEQQIGYSFSVGDGKQLALAVTSLAENRSLCNEMQQNAVKLYRSCYSKEIAMCKYESLIKLLLRTVFDENIVD